MLNAGKLWGFNPLISREKGPSNLEFDHELSEVWPMIVSAMNQT
jgi:hypothetical protein